MITEATNITITPKQKRLAAKAIGKILFYLKEGEDNLEKCVEQALGTSRCELAEIDEIIHHFLVKCEGITNRKRQIIFWETVLQFITIG